MLHPVGSCNYVPYRELGVLTKQQCKQQQIKTETTEPLNTRYQLNAVVCELHYFISASKKATNPPLIGPNVNP